MRHGTLHPPAARRTIRIRPCRLVVVSVLSLSALLATAMPARADHVVVRVMSDSHCTRALLACAEIEQQWRYHVHVSGLVEIAAYTTARGSSLLLPGRVYGDYTIVFPPDPTAFIGSNSCQWSISQRQCSVLVGGLGLPLSTCREIFARASATSTALNDPTRSVMTTTVSVTDRFRICPDGSVTPLPVG